jgi:predicted nucleic acid-binding protein
LRRSPERPASFDQSRGAAFWSAQTLPWELGNAFSAAFKRGRLSIGQTEQALAIYQEQFEVRLDDVSLEQAVRLSEKLDLYAYDDYMLVCAQQHSCPIHTLDNEQRLAAEKVGLEVVYP